MAQSSVAVQRGALLEYLTIGWNSLEAIVAIGAGVIAGSISLVGFGFDSLIEVSSGAIILCDSSLASIEKNSLLNLLARVFLV